MKPPPPLPAPEPPPPPAPSTRGGEISIGDAFSAGDYGRVVEEFEKIRQLYPAYMMGADDLYYLGMSQYYLENMEQALRAFLEFQYRFSGDGRVGEVHLMAARSFRRMGKEGRALDSLLMAIHFAGDDEIRMQAWEEKADILAGQSRWIDALSVLDEAYGRTAAGTKERALTRITELLRVMPDDVVEGAVLRGSFNFPRRIVEAVVAGKDGGGDSSSPAPGKTGMYGERAAPAVNRGDLPVMRIGVLTTSQERLRAYGEEVRRGTELAIQILTGGAYPYAVEPVFIEEETIRDGGSDVESLMADSTVIAIIGPLLSSSVERIVPRAERNGLALFSPTASSPRLNGISPNFFRNCLTIDQLGRDLADMAMERLGLSTFALFSPDDMYGFRFTEAFRNQVLLQGGLIVASGSYAADLTDFAEPIRKLKKEAGMPEEEEALPAEGKRAPLPFDAVFVPGSAEEVGLILPQFAFHDIDVERVTILGGSGLNSSRFPAVGEEYAEGVFFADGFLAGSPRREVQEFVRLFRERYGTSPGTFAAQAYDAAAIIIDLMARGVRERREMLDALGAVKDFPGVAGLTTLFGGGYHERSPFFGTVLGGRLVPVEFQAPAAAAGPEAEGAAEGVLP